MTYLLATIHRDGLEQPTVLAIGRSVGQFTITDRSEEARGRGADCNAFLSAAGRC